MPFLMLFDRNTIIIASQIVDRMSAIIVVRLITADSWYFLYFLSAGICFLVLNAITALSNPSKVSPINKIALNIK